MDRIRKSKLLVGLVSALLLLGIASVSFSLPAPAPMAMLARTQVPPTILSSVGLVDDNQIEGAIVHFEDFSITTDADTTSAIYLGGLIPWRVINESGASATLTFYDARSVSGTALAVVDQDDVAVPTMTIGDDESQELPNSLAGCTVLIIKGAVAADGFTVVAKR